MTFQTYFPSYSPPPLSAPSRHDGYFIWDPYMSQEVNQCANFTPFSSPMHPLAHHISKHLISLTRDLKYAASWPNPEMPLFSLSSSPHAFI